MTSRILVAAGLALCLAATGAVAQDLTWDPSKLPAPMTGYDTDEVAKGLTHGDTPFDAALGQALKGNPALSAYLRYGIEQGVYVAPPVQQVGTPAAPAARR